MDQRKDEIVKVLGAVRAAMKLNVLTYIYYNIDYFDTYINIIHRTLKV